MESTGDLFEAWFWEGDQWNSHSADEGRDVAYKLIDLNFQVKTE